MVCQQRLSPDETVLISNTQATGQENTDKITITLTPSTVLENVYS